MARLLKEGDVIELKEGMEVYADIPETYVYSNRKGSFKLVHTNVRIEKDSITDFLIGKYIVYKTAEEGGGESLTPSGYEYHSNGHSVYCFNVENEDIKVDFYQDNSFTAYIPPESIQPVGKAELTWKIKG